MADPDRPTTEAQPTPAAAMADRLARLESAYLVARETRDRLDVAEARGEPADIATLRAASDARTAEVRATLASLTPADGTTLGAEDARALAAITTGSQIALGEGVERLVAPAVPPGTCSDESAWAAAIDAGWDVLQPRLEGCYAALANSLPAVDAGGPPVTRIQLLDRLRSEPDADVRRRLFLGLAPLWRTIDGDGGDGSPYRALVRESAARWAAGASPIAANAVALGVTAAEIEAWAVGTLGAWRRAVVDPARARGEPSIEPWDWWWSAGEAERALRTTLPIERVFSLNREVHLALGADLEALNVRLDTTPRPGRPPVSVAFTTFGARPHQRADGSWSPGEPTVLATYTDGGLGELTELIHETGHAIHIAGIRTRPAFADWPDSDALTEALAELVSLDVAEPSWLRRWLPDAPPVPTSVTLRGRYSEVALDAAWALLEIRLHADPAARPNDVWTAITEADLGIAPHPEWSWWAMRGQLVQEPGYMANYAIGAVLAADLRAAIRAARGPWLDGDPGWYPWVRDRIYRFGLERTAGDVLRDVLGRPPTVDALLTEIGRAAG